MNSPLRKDDIPSFGVYFYRGNLFFKDFRIGSGDCIKFVSLLQGISYTEAIRQIAYDFNLEDKYNLGEYRPKSQLIGVYNKSIDPEIVETYKLINIQKREWRDYDLKFWAQWSINKETLEFYNMFPISFIFINGDIFPVDKYAYAHREIKDGIVTYKIYQPYSEYFKWISNHNKSIHQGYTQLPKTGDLLIITKSIKDVMSIYSNTFIPSVSVINETVDIKPSVMEEYKSRFKEIIILFDNDEAGIKQSFKYQSMYDLPFILIPKEYDCKDFTDLVKKVGINKSKEILNMLIHDNRF